MIRDQGKHQTNVRLPIPLWLALRQFALDLTKQSGKVITISDIVSRAIAKEIGFKEVK